MGTRSRRPSWPACSGRARAGWPAASGTGWTRCGSPSPTGPRPRPTSTARRRRSWPPPARKGARHDGRGDGNPAHQDGAGGDAQGRRDHGRDRRRPGAYRRGCGRGGGDGPRARSRRHPQGGRGGTKGEAGTGDIVEAVRHLRAVTAAVRRLGTLGPEELMHEAKSLGAPYELVRVVASAGRLPVPNFAAGGIATPADAALMMSLGAEAVFVGSGIFKSSDPAARARAIVKATTHHQDAKAVAEASRGLGEPMRGLDVAALSPAERLQTRGW